ncbi:unnamed protein product [Ectocarpus sp. 8 AP-2014]|nr:unnamed protein product [Ectocarpus sp. CCAP 1310/34]
MASAGGDVTRRLQQELMGIMMGADPGASAFPNDDNLFEWTATLCGSEDTAYEGLTYKLKLVFPETYPYKAPLITFETPCFHPNVDEHGNICLDILKEKWSSAFSVSTILQSLRSLLADPNNESPLNTEAAQLWADQDKYRQVCKQKYQEGAGEA